MSEVDEKKPAARSLARKVAEIVAAVSHVPKAGHNAHFNYDFAQEADVLLAVRGEMAKRHLALFPSVVAHNVREVQGKSGGALYVTTLRVEFTLVDGESGEERAFSIIGEGEDNHDKGANKALTSAEKYCCLKLFMLPTGADPDGDGPSEEVPRQASQARTAPPQERRSPVAAPRTESGRAVNHSGNLPTTFPNFGRAKGAPIQGASPQDLDYYSNAARRSLADPSKARFHDKERTNLAAYEAEMQRRSGGQARGDGPDDAMGDYGAPPPGDDDAPF